MSAWYLVSVFLHVVFAAFWLGGMLFLPLVVLPALAGNTQRADALLRAGLKFRFYGWVALSGLAVTGVLNVYLRGLPPDRLAASDYGAVLGIKLCVFGVVLLLSAAHDFLFGRKAAECMEPHELLRARWLARWSGRANLLLSLVVAFMGVWLSRGAAVHLW